VTPSWRQLRLTMIRRSKRFRFDLWEVLLITLAAAATVYVLTAPPWGDVQSARELEYFQKRYGPGRNSEREEEWLIRDFFNDRRGGFFVDVGAHHYRKTSKTYYLETELGWSGIAIEPQQEFAADYARHRPRTRFFPFFVSSTSNEWAKLFVLSSNRSIASGDESFVRMFGEPDDVRSVPTITLTELLDREGVEAIDFLSMDIELHEPEALRGFDIGRFRPKLVCIEGLGPVRQAILDYFARNQYVIVGRYIWVDRENFYFMPLPAEDTPS
jgi:FkbM family methyltransferase